MGIFKRKSKAVDYVRLLENIGIDVFGLTHDNLNSVELTVDEEINGIKQKSEGQIENKYFERILFQEKEDKTRNVVLSKQEMSEKDFRDLVNLFYELLGVDSLLQEKMDLRDLEKIRGLNEDYLPEENIREWETFYTNGINYTTGLSYSVREKTALLTVASKPTYWINKDKPKVQVKK
jgi:hypothetical protein